MNILNFATLKCTIVDTISSFRISRTQPGVPCEGLANCGAGLGVPIERAILQSGGNVFFDSRLEIRNILISEPRIFTIADIEAEMINHRLHARNSKFHIRGAAVDLIVAGAPLSPETGPRRPY